MTTNQPLLKNNRPNWDDYFINIAKVVAQRSTCDRGNVGCIITKDNRIISTGYNGAPAGFSSCDDEGHLMQKVEYDTGDIKEHCVRSVHAEQNAIIHAAKHGVSINEATLYCTLVPCTRCAMMIVTAGIKRVVAEDMYSTTKETTDIFNQAKIVLDIRKS